MLSDLQPDGFLVQAVDEIEALKITLEWAMKEYPGMFVVINGVWQLKQAGYPLIKESTWH